MGSSERKEREKKELRERIMKVASGIVAEEGYASLSIRKIAAKIEYSPGIIYHYFRDKREIVDSIVADGYARVVEMLRIVEPDMADPLKTVETALRQYIELMLRSPEQYRAFIMRSVEGTGDRINVLSNGIGNRRETFGMFSRILSYCRDRGAMRDLDPELTAQILWTATHGLINRLILEQGIGAEQRERLITYHFEILFRGLAAGKAEPSMELRR